MKRLFQLLLLGGSILAFSGVASAEEVTEVDEKTGVEWKLLDEEKVEISSFAENDTLNTPLGLPEFEHTGGGSLSSPAQIQTNKVFVQGTPISIEYTLKDGSLVFFEREGYYYDYQNWTQSYFNAVTGTITGTAASGYLTKLTYSIAGKVPYLSRVFDKYGKTVKDYSGYVTASGAMVFLSQPVFGKITYSAVPTVGTKESIVYVSTSGNSGTWKYRARFVLSGQNLTVSTWTTS